MKIEIAADVTNILGESPFWDEVSGALWWVDIKQCRLYRRREETAVVDMWTLPRAATVVTSIQDSKDMLLACTGALMRFNVDSGECVEVSPFEADLVGNRPNDGKCDPQGRLWVGSMDDAEEHNNGTLYRIDKDLSVTSVLGGLGIPNTLEWSADRKIFYFADSRQQTIWAFDYDNSTGAIENRRVFASLKGTGFYPDGSAIDAEGFLWNAQWNGWRVVRYAPDGSIDRVVDLPVACPTSCMFGGDNLQTLFVTSARVGQSEAALARQPHAGDVFMLAPGVKGLRQTAFQT